MRKISDTIALSSKFVSNKFLRTVICNNKRTEPSECAKLTSDLFITKKTQLAHCRVVPDTGVYVRNNNYNVNILRCKCPVEIR